jgi:3-oxoacyl-[acyl-carrier protein] reductase
MEITLQGRTAVICGSTQGIGKAIAEAFAAAGATCILLARDRNKLEEVRSELSVPADQAHQFMVADFSDLNAVEAVVKEIAASTNAEILVNNTGGPKPGAITEASTGEFVKAFEQHIICNQLIAGLLLPGMKRKNYGRIINIVSTSVKIPIPNLGVSNTIRAAVAGWAKTWANEVGQFNVTVNNILPGLTETSRLNSLISNMSQQQGVSEKNVEDELKNSIPMKRFGKASELANLALFLASPAASYITGTSIPVDGGRTGTLS